MGRSAGVVLDNRSGKTARVDNLLLRRANPTLGLFLVCLIPAKFWTAAYLFVAHLHDIYLSLSVVLAVGAGIAGFLALVLSGLWRMRPCTVEGP
ncbi:protein of unknown function [Candidatus Filomicrobium marinum]|uniref:Uncharacterized protein n=2 Tax=Filomicrobium TaxID=119044 RepID=A0A0D6JHB1_9HYPH|nr:MULTISPECIES: hypothetical protein [Filomicrobium]MCV0369844.1 hypothetical protein [Filomicrobium sp.]CFX51773.1 protein of unknown function [Candidatus Filomicrobium marinum]CPR20094.1 protein of unknown function [Candidatus Filomicrobium marinum]SDP10065.1 hypothetical protein SAMN04488061_2187 [Filomicrobium insigne]